MKTIFTGFAPNLTVRDAGTASSFLFFHWNLYKTRKGKFIAQAEEKLKDYFKIKHVSTFDSGRTALYFSLKALGVGESDEVLVQAYTCVVVSNAIIKTKAKPIYVDIDNRFCMNPADLEKKITSKSKVLIIQHTFGGIAQLDKLLAIAKKHKLKVIEDNAHSLGTKYNGQLTGTFGDIGMLSFGSDKIISCVRGGALITDNDELGKKIKDYQDKLPLPSFSETRKHLFSLVIFFFSKPLYGLFVGKLVIFIARKLNTMHRIIYSPEKKGCDVNFYPAKLANALARILIDQISEIDKVNEHRKKIAHIYNNSVNNSLIKKPLAHDTVGCVYLRYPILIKEPKKLRDYAKKKGIILGSWYDTVIAPPDIDLEKTGYVMGSCPKAEELSSLSANLPTNRHVSEKDAERVCRVVNDYKL